MTLFDFLSHLPLFLLEITTFYSNAIHSGTILNVISLIKINIFKFVLLQIKITKKIEDEFFLNF